MKHENIVAASENAEAEKPDFVKEIESFDMNNLSPENVEFMTNVIQGYFLDNFPVEPQLVNELAGRIEIVDEDDDDDVDNDGPVDKAGRYDAESKKIIIDRSKHETIGDLFNTMFHESLHYVSIGAGAGLKGVFKRSDEIDEDDELFQLMRRGGISLMEGTTHMITLSSVVGDMGFDDCEHMDGYSVERSIAKKIWWSMPEPIDAMYDAYFKTSLESIGDRIDKMFGHNAFAGCLINIGFITNEVNRITDEEEVDKEALAEIAKDIERAVKAYVERLQSSAD